MQSNGLSRNIEYTHESPKINVIFPIDSQILTTLLWDVNGTKGSNINSVVDF